MTTKGTLVIMRHGQTGHNINHLRTGRLDVPLTETGEEQARAAGPLIEEIHFDKAFCTPLSRTFNTAMLALEAAGQHILVEPREEIIERNDGNLTGHERPLGDASKFHRDYDEKMPGGGESRKDVVTRVRKFYEEEVLPLLARGKNLLIVGHHGTALAWDIVLGLEPEPADGTGTGTPMRPARNANPSVYEYEDGVLATSYDLVNPVTKKTELESARASRHSMPATPRPA